MHEMEEILAFLDRYVPGYVTEASGASAEQIDDLEEAFERPLPGFFRHYLSALGNDTGALFQNNRTHDPFSIADLYRCGGRPPLPPHRFLFAFSTNTLDNCDYFLDLEQPAGGGDYRIVRFPIHEDAWKKPSESYSSLSSMLYILAAENVVIPSLPLQQKYGSGAAHPPLSADDYAAEVADLWFTVTSESSDHILLERLGAVILVERFPGTPEFLINVGMSDPDDWPAFEALTEKYTDADANRRARMLITRIGPAPS